MFQLCEKFRSVVLLLVRTQRFACGLACAELVGEYGANFFLDGFRRNSVLLVKFKLLYPTPPLLSHRTKGSIYLFYLFLVFLG